jgi:glycosyltransferase involved in cell wall biosynthesis
VNRPRALVISNLFPSPGRPHRATFNRQHYAALSKFFDVRVICPLSWTEVMGSARSRERSKVIEGIQVDYPVYYFPPRILRRYYGWFLWQSIRETARSVATEFKPDVVVASWAYPDGYAAAKLSRVLNLPLAVQVLGSDINQLDLFPDKSTRTWTTLRQADIIIPVSKALQTRILENGIAPERIKVVYRGVNTELFHPADKLSAREELSLDPKNPILLFAGNLVPVKSVDTLVAATAQVVSEKHPMLVTHVIGDGPLKSALKSQASALGIANNIHFHGTIPHSSLPTWIAAADVVVLPSLHEGVPNILLETIASHRPYVASRTGGIPEISSHGSCRLFPPGNVTALAEAILAMLRCDNHPTAADLPCASWDDAGQNLAATLSETIARWKSEQ